MQHEPFSHFHLLLTCWFHVSFKLNIRLVWLWNTGYNEVFDVCDQTQELDEILDSR